MQKYINNVSYQDSLEVGMYKLKPLDGQQKSFYNKAEVCVSFDRDGRLIATLYSYDTRILEYNYSTREYRRYWGGWSKTTMAHVQAFCGKYIPKRLWSALGVGVPVFTQSSVENITPYTTMLQLD